MNFKSGLNSSSSLIDLTPIVDVIFLLLIFFIITSDILPLKSLNVENPKLDRESSPLTTQILVVMDSQNVIFLGQKKDIVDMAALKELLIKEISFLQKQHPGVNPSVVLSVDKRVQYDAFLKLFSAAQECSSRVRLVYKPTEEEYVDMFETISEKM
jgi:biopolymer transport protein ExbD